MTTAAGPYATVSFRRIVAERLSDSDTALAAGLLDVAGVLRQYGVCSSLRYAGEPPRFIQSTVSAIADYVAKVRQDRVKNIPTIFRLSGGPSDRAPALFLDFETTPVGSFDAVWVSVPSSLAQSLGAAETLSNALAEACLAFGAFHGAVEDEFLTQLYRGRRAAERARSRVPPELRQFVPEPLVPIAGASGFPSLLVPQDFDRRRVPDAVWWINFWDAVQVETVQLSRIETAGFAGMFTQPSGALLLLTTQHPLDPTDSTDLQHLSRIVEHLELQRLQESARI